MKTTKRILAILLTALLLATSVPFALAEESMPGYVPWNLLHDALLLHNGQAAFYFSFPGGTISVPGGVGVFDAETANVVEAQYPSDGWTMIPEDQNDLEQGSRIHLPRVQAPAGFVFAGWKRIPQDLGDSDSSIYNDRYEIRSFDIGRVCTFEAVFEEDPGFVSWSLLNGYVNEDQAAFYFAFSEGKISQPGGVSVLNVDTGILEENEYPSDGWTMIPSSPDECRNGDVIHLPRVQAPAGFVFSGWKHVPIYDGDMDSSVYDDSYTVRPHEVGRVARFEAVFEADPEYVSRHHMPHLVDQHQAVYYFTAPGGTIYVPGGMRAFDIETGSLDEAAYKHNGWTMIPEDQNDLIQGFRIHLPRVQAPAGFVFSGWKRVPKAKDDFDASVYQDRYEIQRSDIGRVGVFEAVYEVDPGFVPQTSLSNFMYEGQAAFYFAFPGGKLSVEGGVSVYNGGIGSLKQKEFPSDGWTMIPASRDELKQGDVLDLPRVQAPAGFVFSGWKRVARVQNDLDTAVYNDTYEVKASDIAGHYGVFEAVFEVNPGFVSLTTVDGFVSEDQAICYFSFPEGTITGSEGVRVFDIETGGWKDEFEYPMHGWTMIPSSLDEMRLCHRIRLPLVQAPAGFVFIGWERIPRVRDDFDNSVYVNTYDLQQADIVDHCAVFEAVFVPDIECEDSYELSSGETLQVTLQRGQESLFSCTAEQARYYKITWNLLTDVSSSGRITYHLYDASMKQVIDVGLLAYGGNLRGIPLLEGECAYFGLSFEGYEEIGDSLEVNVTLNEGELLPAAGSLDSGLTYTFSPEGTLSLGGTVDCSAIDANASDLFLFYNYAIKRLEIGAGVQNFFEGFYQSGLEKLLLAECEAIIPAEDHPQYAYENGMILDREQTTVLLWWDRDNTEEIRIPEGVKTIFPFAFSPSPFDLDDVVSNFGLVEFLHEYQLPPMPSAVVGSSTLEDVSDYAFANCYTLTEFSGADQLRYIGDSAFANCFFLSEMPYSSNLEEIGEAAFQNCWTLQEASIPDAITVIGAEAFSGCAFMESVSIGNGVKALESGTFAGCPMLKQVQLAEGLEVIEDDAFTACYSLRSLVLPASLQQLGSIGAVLDQGLVVRGEETVLESINLPFPTCNLEEFAGEISFPPSLQQAVVDTDEEPDRVLAILAYAAMLNEIGGGEMFGLLAYQGNVEKGLAFERSIWITLSAAFETAAAPAEATFLPTIYGHVGSPAQTFAEENSYPFFDISEPFASGDCGDDAHWTLNRLGTLTISGTGAMWDYLQDNDLSEAASYAQYVQQIVSVVIEEGITSIGECAFVFPVNDESLIGGRITEVSIPATVTKIGSAAFSNSYHLREIDIPDSVTTIGENAFEYCKSLQRVALPANLTTIETGLFIGCVNLTEITIPAGVKTIGAVAFYNCNALQKAIIHSPDCVFADELVQGDLTLFDIAEYALPETTVIYGRAGSTSEAYAQTYDRQFVNHYIGAQTKAATCTEAGVMTYICDCGDTYTEEIPVLAHNYVTETVNSDCKTHGYTRTYCTVGGEETERTELPLAAHTPGAPVKENEAAATTDHGGSYDEVVYCTACGEEISRTAKTTDPLPKDDGGQQPEKKLNFFQRIIEWFRNLFRRLFRR